MLRPSLFFRRIRPDAPLGPAVVYLLIIAVLTAGARLFWTMVFGPAETPVDAGTPQMHELMGYTATAAQALIDFLLSPLYALLTLGIATLAIHAGLFVLGAARGGLRDTARTLCYAYGPQLLAVVPYLGELAGGLWMIALAVVGIRETHGTSTGRATVAVLLPLLVVAFVLFWIALGAALFGVLGGAG